MENARGAGEQLSRGRQHDIQAGRGEPQPAIRGSPNQKQFDGVGCEFYGGLKPCIGNGEHSIQTQSARANSALVWDTHGWHLLRFTSGALHAPREHPPSCGSWVRPCGW
jgi:hypothetical protein